MLFGIDEVGRGAWAGPLVFATVGIDQNIEYDFLHKLKDSKKLTKPKLHDLDKLITQHCFYATVAISSKYIDRFGLTNASIKACTELAENICNVFKNPNIIVDGNINYLCESEYAKISKCMIKADSTIYEVMSASIVAKVYRDKIMANYSEEYPGFNFKSNVGYGTTDHIEALKVYGSTPIHRQSYKPIKNLNEK